MYARISVGMGEDLRSDEQARLVAVIDDDLSVRRALARLLRATGMSVETYASAEEFLDRRNGRAYSLLLVDVAMKQMSGIDMLEQLAAAGGSMPAIVITGVDTEAIRARARRFGAPVLRKPIETDDLLESVGRAIGRDLGGRNTCAGMSDSRGARSNEQHEDRARLDSIGRARDGR